MTKQEQIEEMGKIMPEKIKDPLDNSRYIIFGKSLRREIARIYYNAGYRKVPDGAVIIPAEERDGEMKAYNEERAELEREIEKLKIQLEQANAGNVNCIGCKLVEINAVRDFAEKLKNKLFKFFQDNEELDGKISVGPLYVDVIGVDAKDGTIISLGLIDELIKEFEK